MTEKYIKIIERESNLEQFAEGGIQPNVKIFKYGRVYKKRNGMMIVYRDESQMPTLTLRNYTLSLGNALVINWSTQLYTYDSQYNLYSDFLREANL